MSRRMPLVALSLIVPVLALLVACGAPASNEVDMGVANFRQGSITVNAGDTVHFVDPPTGGGVHVLCIGSGLDCVPQPGAPTELNTKEGINFSQGDTKDIVFHNRGTFVVVCTIHPGMAVTITVQ
ncbi:MAG TPA: plastocyanin/azurin family copper-binding protein [Ktedonobacterales bacterium]